MNLSLAAGGNSLLPVNKLKEIKHRYLYARQDKEMCIAMAKYSKCKHKKPAGQIKKEMNLCKSYWGCYPLHYIRYELYRKDRQLTEEELLDFIPEYFFYRLFLKFHDSGQHSILLSEKFITEQTFRSLNINQPLTLAKLINGNLFTCEIEDLDYSHFEGILNSGRFGKVFIKPVNGEGGAGIFSFQRRSTGNYLSSQNELLNEQFLSNISKGNNYILQAGIIQHPDFMKIYPHSVNTLRITTENINGRIRIPCVVLRMGRSGSEVDNSCQGGLFITVDIDSGSLADQAYTHAFDVFPCHPDTGFAFSKYRIPNWDEVKKFAVSSARKLHYFTYLGWDIALTPLGPLAIESNLYFGLDIYQVAMGGIRKHFGIEDPAYYWKNMHKKTK